MTWSRRIQSDTSFRQRAPFGDFFSLRSCLGTCLAASYLLGMLECEGGALIAREAPTHILARAEQVPTQQGFSYQLEVLHFSAPRRVSVGAGIAEFSSTIEIQVRGRGLESMNLTPVIYLNGFMTARTHVSPDGRFLRGWLYGVSLAELEAAAQAQGEWSLFLAPRPGVRPSIRVSPNPTGALPGQRPEIHVSRR